jgi:hypothetical protein
MIFIFYDIPSIVGILKIQFFYYSLPPMVGTDHKGRSKSLIWISSFMIFHCWNFSIIPSSLWSVPTIRDGVCRWSKFYFYDIPLLVFLKFPFSFIPSPLWSGPTIKDGGCCWTKFHFFIAFCSYQRPLLNLKLITLIIATFHLIKLIFKIVFIFILKHK